MLLRAPLFVSAVALAAAIASPSFADSINLVSVSDNTLYESATGALSNGAGSGMFAGRTAQVSNNIRRAVVRFDFSAIPAGSTINNVELHVSMTQTVAPDVEVTLHPVTSSWGEGTSIAGGGQGGGASSTTNDATWKHRFFPGTNWGSLGGDFGPAQSSQIIGDLGNYVFPSTAPFVSRAQLYLDTPASNFGWMLRGDEVNDGSAKRFATKEYPVVNNRPTLVVEYTPPGVPAEAVTWGSVKSLYR